MNKVLLLVGFMLLVGCQSEPPQESEQTVVETPNIDSVLRLTLQEVDEFLAQKQSGILYFGWITNCGDSRNFQENYLEGFLEEHSELKDNFYIVDLDDQAPDALMDKELREPLTKTYDVSYSPTLLTIQEGETVDKIEWTLKNSDPQTAIPAEDLDAYFQESGFIQ